MLVRLADLINLAMWTPPTIIEDLVAQAKEIYIQGSPLRHFIEEIDEAIWPILLSKPTKAVKLSITLEQIVNLQDVSFHTKIYALMDMAYHNVSCCGLSTIRLRIDRICCAALRGRSQRILFGPFQDCRLRQEILQESTLR